MHKNKSTRGATLVTFSSFIPQILLKLPENVCKRHFVAKQNLLGHVTDNVYGLGKAAARGHCQTVGYLGESSFSFL